LTTYRRHPATVSTELGDEVVALQLDTKRYYTLNQTAACAWRRLAAQANAQEVASALEGEFTISRDAAAPHVTRLLHKLLACRLIEVCE
jgi:hypothetical protein